MSPRIDKNERIQLAMNKTIAIDVSSSMNVFCETLNNFREVSTIKQSPKRFEEAFSIWGDLSFCFSIFGHLNIKGDIIFSRLCVQSIGPAYRIKHPKIHAL